MVKRGGFRNKRGGRFRGKGRGRGGGRARRDSEGFKNTEKGRQFSKKGFRGPKKGKLDEGKLDDMLDSYWGKSDKDDVKGNIKKLNDEILMNNLDSYWAKKDAVQKEAPPQAEEPQEEAKK